MSQIGNQDRTQPLRGLHRVDVDTVRRCGCGVDDAGVVVVHTSGCQHRTGISLTEGEQSRLAELFESLVSLAEDSGELHPRVAQWERRVAVGRPEVLAQGDRLFQLFLARIRVLAQLDQPRPIDSGQCPHHLIGRPFRIWPPGGVSRDRLPQGRSAGTTGADGVDILQSTGNVVPTAHIRLHRSSRTNRPAPGSREHQPRSQPRTAALSGRWGEGTST